MLPQFSKTLARDGKWDELADLMRTHSSMAVAVRASIVAAAADAANGHTNTNVYSNTGTKNSEDSDKDSEDDKEDTEDDDEHDARNVGTTTTTRITPAEFANLATAMIRGRRIVFARISPIPGAWYLLTFRMRAQWRARQLARRASEAYSFAEAYRARELGERVAPWDAWGPFESEEGAEWSTGGLVEEVQMMPAERTWAAWGL